MFVEASHTVDMVWIRVYLGNGKGSREEGMARRERGEASQEKGQEEKGQRVRG